MIYEASGAARRAAVNIRLSVQPLAVKQSSASHTPQRAWSMYHAAAAARRAAPKYHLSVRLVAVK